LIFSPALPLDSVKHDVRSSLTLGILKNPNRVMFTFCCCAYSTTRPISFFLGHAGSRSVPLAPKHTDTTLLCLSRSIILLRFRTIASRKRHVVVGSRLLEPQSWLPATPGRSTLGSIQDRSRIIAPAAFCAIATKKTKQKQTTASTQTCDRCVSFLAR